LNVANCSRLNRTNLVGTWYRATPPRFLSDAIATHHTISERSRFSPATKLSPGFEILYLAENQLTAMYEVGALFGSAASPGGVIPNPGLPIVVLPISINLTSIVDLTKATEALQIETNAQELTGDWRGFHQRPALGSTLSPHTGKAPTQQLGEELFRLGSCHGFISFSARLPDYKILGVFPQRLRTSTNTVSYYYTDEIGQQRTIHLH